jgi:hypothetical protein
MKFGFTRGLGQKLAVFREVQARGVPGGLGRRPDVFSNFSDQPLAIAKKPALLSAISTLMLAAANDSPRKSRIVSFPFSVPFL